MARRVLFVVILVGLFADPALGTPKGRWYEARSDHFTVVGNAPEQTLIEVGRNLERLRWVLSQVSTLSLDSPTPTVIYVFKNQEHLAPFLHRGADGRLPTVDGAFVRTPHSNFILVNGEHAQKVRGLIYHEYVHFFVGYNFPSLPLWFEEGLAELYSTFDADASHAYLGKVVLEHLIWLRENPWIPLDELLAVNARSPIYNEATRRGAFYAQSWALVHYLVYGHGEGAALPRLLHLLRSSPPERAFQQALGGSYDDIEAALRRYTRRQVHVSQQLPIDARERYSVRTRRLSKPEASVRLGDLLSAQSGREDDAVELLRAALKRGKRLAPPHREKYLALTWRGLGLTAERRQSFQDAIGHYERALAIHPDDEILKALLLRARLLGGHDHRQVRRELQQLVDLHPGFPLALTLLAATYGQPGVTAEEAERGIPIFRRALELAPESTGLAKMFLRVCVWLGRHDDVQRLEVGYFRPRGINVRDLLDTDTPTTDELP